MINWGTKYTKEYYQLKMNGLQLLIDIINQKGVMKIINSNFCVCHIGITTVIIIL